MNRLPAAFAGVRVLDPDCVVPGLHCLPDQSNVVDVFFGVGSASECQLSCAYHTGRCRLFTWFDAAHPTFPRSCFLYTSCAAAGRSEHSLTGPATCTCGEKKACQGVRHNFVGFQARQVGMFVSVLHCLLFSISGQPRPALQF